MVMSETGASLAELPSDPILVDAPAVVVIARRCFLSSANGLSPVGELTPVPSGFVLQFDGLLIPQPFDPRPVYVVLFLSQPHHSLWLEQLSASLIDIRRDHDNLWNRQCPRRHPPLLGGRISDNWS